MTEAAWFKPARITERILQNGYITEVQAAELQRRGVTHLLNLDLPYASTRIVMPAGLTITELLVHDMAPLSADDARRVVAVLQRALDLDGGRVYVHCNAGLSRSPTAVWLYLVASGWEPEQASAVIAAAAKHLDAPDSILVSELDLDALRTWAGQPRWEVWLRGTKTHDSLLAVLPTEAAAAAERDALEAKARAWAARGREVHVRYEVLEARPR
jgi:hypothetical protein